MAMSSLSMENLSKIFEGGEMFSSSQQSSQAQVGPSFESALQGQLDAQAVPESLEGLGNLLRNSIDKVNQDQSQANTAIHELISGRNKNVHEAMLAVERADLSLKMMMQVRNKLLEAYREVMRMQV